jgi:hypothetical protein
VSLEGVTHNSIFTIVQVVSYICVDNNGRWFLLPVRYLTKHVIHMYSNKKYCFSATKSFEKKTIRYAVFWI